MLPMRYAFESPALNTAGPIEAPPRGGVKNVEQFGPQRLIPLAPLKPRYQPETPCPESTSPALNTAGPIEAFDTTPLPRM